MTAVKQRLVIVGNGMGSVRLLEHLCDSAPAAFDITVLSEESEPGYNRILLSPLLAGEMAPEGVQLKGRDWYQVQGIHLYSGPEYRAVSIDRQQQCVKTAGGESFGYDKLVLATGSSPFIPPLPGSGLDGVYGFRTLADVDGMLAAVAQGGNAIVVGGGLLGLEAAAALQAQGMQATVVHNREVLMNRQLDAVAGGLLRNSLADKGIDCVMASRAQSLQGDAHGRVTGLGLEDGRVLLATLVVFAAGVQPNIKLMQDAGLECDRALLVDAHMSSSDPAIYGLGECVQHQGETFGLVEPVYKQADVLAHVLSGAKAGPGFESGLTATRLKVTGVELFSCGDFEGEEADDQLILSMPSQGVYRKLVLRDNRLTGILLYGDASDALWYQKLLEQQADISTIKELLMFGEAFLSDSDDLVA